MLFGSLWCTAYEKSICDSPLKVSALADHTQKGIQDAVKNLKW